MSTSPSSRVPRKPRVIGPRSTFAIVASMYNQNFVGGLLEAAKNEILGIMPNASVPLYRVPGAYEIPVCCEYIIQYTKADVIIALGVIMRGETAHADLVARTVTDSLQNIACRRLVPIINEVLLLDDEQQAYERCMGQEINRGAEAARAALNMAELWQKLHTAYPEKIDREAEAAKIRAT
ncbi:MAG: 6,7-dimethyl-8-ribityllumazine synthase [Verrucomicrobiales bacterium]|nr:6,7-dimethyl-8-ribityllumazine synthase [Verrucomicrobiae bacterium]